ncbi:MAG: alpha/beta fold hydrolase [Pseudomonadota bacterium]|nr:alpha/beta fold hydrolase [Pseudomonadota bacterium]
MSKNYQLDGPDDAPLFILAHGAGAGSDSDFMQQMAALLAQRGIAVVRFDFPYMEQSRMDGKRRPPSKAPALMDDFRSLIQQLGRPCVIGGKSMGGRIASMIYQHEDLPQVKGCTCLGYPFHPPGKPDRLRTDHLQTLTKPLLIVQGTRDALGSQDEVRGYALADNIGWLWLEDGNHDLKPRKASGFTQHQHLLSAADAIAAFVRQQLGR